MATTRKTLEEINRRIQTGQLFLPSLPDNLLRIRSVLNDPDASNSRISTALAGDAGLATRVLKVANSALHSGRGEVQSLQQAVNRLGNRLLNSLVNSYHLLQMICHSQAQHAAYIRYLHQHSLEVAAYSYALATRLPTVNADDALLAGLLHDIGYLPLLEFLPANDQTSPARELYALRGLKTGLTERLLNEWQFPAALIRAAREHEHYHRSCREADLTDLITVADLNALRHESLEVTGLDWHRIGAFQRTGIDPDVPLDELPVLDHPLRQAKIMLGI